MMLHLQQILYNISFQFAFKNGQIGLTFNEVFVYKSKWGYNQGFLPVKFISQIMGFNFEYLHSGKF